MTSYICIIISLFIPLASAAYAKFSVRGYDNSTPREFLNSLQGKAKRAHHAQNNFYETFPAFAVGVVAAHQLNANASTIDALAITYLIARIFYAFFYVIDKSVLRTLSWTTAFGAIIGLYLIGF